MENGIRDIECLSCILSMYWFSSFPASISRLFIGARPLISGGECKYRANQVGCMIVTVTDWWNIRGFLFVSYNIQLET